MARTKFIIVEGVDGVGKSSIKDRILSQYAEACEIKFQKNLQITGELTRINTEKDLMILSTLFPMLSQDRVYVLDRFILSNLVYDGVFRGEDTSMSLYYYKKFKEENNVLELIFTRDHITTDFVDDRIAIPMDQFNSLIDEYAKYGPNYQIIKHREGGIDLISDIHAQVVDLIHKFITTEFPF